jgi:metal-dependent amidase/aminoacylase/carboxypeptidase family protein
MISAWRRRPIVAYFCALSRVGAICTFVAKLFTMQIPHLINLLHGEMTAWRQDLHAHPELGFEEHRTSEFVAGKLAEFGCEVHRNIGKTGVVGVLRTDNGPSIGLRADMDALPISEANDIPYRSKHDGIMLGCVRP